MLNYLEFMQQITGESEPSKDVVNVKKIKNLLEKDVHGLQEQGEGAKTEKKLKKIKGKLSVTKKQQRGNGTDMAAQKTDIIVPAVDTDKELSASDGTMIANPVSFIFVIIYSVAIIMFIHKVMFDLSLRVSDLS